MRGAPSVSWLRRVGANFKRYAGDETLSFWMEHDEWARPGESFNDYCARMAKQGEFGGGPEIIALSQQFGGGPPAVCPR